MTQQPITMLRLPTVIERVGMGKTSIYKLIKQRKFPGAVKIGGASLWPEHEVETFLRDQITARPGSRPSDSSS